MINDALDELPKAVDQEQDKRIEAIRDKLSSEIGLIFDLSKREAHRICNTPDPTPTPPDSDVTLIMDPPQTPYQLKPPSTPEEEVWVTQDLVPDRPNFDQWRWVGQNGKDANHGWHHSTNSPYFMHGYIDPANGKRFEVRCRPEDLPTPTPPKTPCKCAWCEKPAFKGWVSGKCPYCGCQETEPSPTPAEDQNRTLSGSHGDYSLPVMDIDVQIFPPDPTFIQVDNPGIPGL